MFKTLTRVLVLVALFSLATPAANDKRTRPGSAKDPAHLTGKPTKPREMDAGDRGCPVQFMRHCRCGEGHYPLSPQLPETPTKYIVNCTNARFNNAKMLQFLPENTEVLIFTGNTLGELPNKLFGSRGNYDFLSTIDLSNNKITFIPGRAFHKVSSVQTLFLNHNDIEISERERPRMFSNFDSLVNLHLTNAFTEKTDADDYLLSLEDIFYMSDLSLVVKLHLEQNEIYTIGKNTSIFCELRSLQQLYIGDNKLFDLDFKLDCMPDLVYIDLQRNSINKLSNDAMTSIDRFVRFSPESRLTIELRMNPFVCDCYSRKFIKWLSSTNVTVRDGQEYRCTDGNPRNVIGKSMLKLDASKLKCPFHAEVMPSHPDGTPHPSHPHHHIVQGYSSSTVAILSFVFAFFSSILVALAVYYRMHIKSKVYPHWEYLTRKVGYSGLAREEVNKNNIPVTVLPPATYRQHKNPTEPTGPPPVAV